MAINLGDALLKIGVDKKDFDRDMKGLSGAINRHKKAIGIAMVGMGVAAIGAAAASVKAFADMGDEVQKMALRTNFSTEALSELRHAAEISGADINVLEKGVKKMSKTIVDADEGMATYIRSFDRIGLSAEELMELSPEDQFIRITEAIAELESPTLRAATAQDIFGRAGTQLLPLMAEGKEGLKDLREEAHKLGIVFDQEAADSAAEFKDSLTRLNGALNGVKFTLARELMPSLEAGIPLLEEWVRALGPVIENTLNWHAAYDKQLKQSKAWEDMMLQRQRMTGGLAHELGNSLDILESILRNEGKLNEQAQETIKRLRDEIKAREDHTRAIEAENEVTQEQLDLQEEQLEAYEKTTKMIEEAILELEYERSVVGRLGITIDDIIKTLHIMKFSNEEITETLVALGEEQENVLTVMSAFGLTAEEIAKAMKIEMEAVEDLAEAYDDLADSAGDADELRGREVRTRKGGGTRGELKDWMTPEQVAYQHGWDWFNLTPQQYQHAVKHAGNPPGYKEGGIVMSPTLAMVGEQAPRVPEAIIPLDKLGGMMGGREVNIFVELDGRMIARAIGQPLVDLIRLKTGVRL